MIGGGELPGGDLSGGRLPGSQLFGDGELPGGKLSGGELPGSELSGGELPDGELSGGELSSGRLFGAPALPCARCAFTWLCGLSKQLYISACVLIKRNEICSGAEQRYIKAIVSLRAQELCESRGGRPGLPVRNSPYGLCGCKATLNRQRSIRNSTHFCCCCCSPEKERVPVKNVLDTVIWFHFKEGYSNAVRRNVKMQDLM